jgi:hypothetical protein
LEERCNELYKRLIEAVADTDPSFAARLALSSAASRDCVNRRGGEDKEGERENVEGERVEEARGEAMDVDAEENVSRPAGNSLDKTKDNVSVST